MAPTSLAPSGPTPVSSTTTTTPQPNLQQLFDHTLYYLLSLWPALSLAVQNQWGGPSSSDKRDWLAGTISTLFDERPDTDQYDVEDVLLQVMADEFDVQVEDESEVKVAEEIVRVRREIIGEGRTEGAERVRERWERSQGRKVQMADGGEQGSEDGSVDGEDEDEEMGEAPAVQREERRREEPEVDEEGFTTVRRKR
ncbi:Pre-rRNA-processing protein tsr2-like protein [Elsinoe fawcettii]|nr:Pre-rRNA-processing protein tsr2-like protein [Elsinoe fawcettii]